MNAVSNSNVRIVTGGLGDTLAAPGAQAPTVLHVIGSRSEAVRLASVIAALDRRNVRQAVARIGSGDAQVIDAAGVPRTAEVIAAATDVSPSVRSAAILGAFEQRLNDGRPELVLIGGDSDEAMACALAASKLGIPIARVAAGRRCGDWSLGEEINRVLIDRLANLLFADSSDAVDALHAEGIEGDHVDQCGSTVVDLVRRWTDDAISRPLPRRLGVAPGQYVLVTLHRRENLLDPERVARIADALDGLAKRSAVVFPLHPIVREALGADVRRLEYAGVRITDPLDYLDFLSLEAQAGAVLTDSGCVQEETSALGIQCYTLRRATERTVTLVQGTNVLLGDDPAEILAVRVAGGPAMPAAIPGWDGNAGERIATVLCRQLAARAAA